MVVAWPSRIKKAWSTPTSALSPVPNLYLTDGSVLPTQGSANPALTIMSLAARAARSSALARSSDDVALTGSSHDFRR